MDYAIDILGRGIVAKLHARVAAPVLVIGADKFTRADLAAVECFNFMAAARLSVALAALKVASTRDVFHHVEPEALALPGIGAFCLAVLGACFERKGVGTLHQWVERTRQKHETITTFQTMKSSISKTTTRSTRRTRGARTPRRVAADK